MMYILFLFLQNNYVCCLIFSLHPIYANSGLHFLHNKCIYICVKSLVDEVYHHS